MKKLGCCVDLATPCPSLDIWCFTQFRLKENKASVGGKNTDHGIVFYKLKFEKNYILVYKFLTEFCPSLLNFSGL